MTLPIDPEPDDCRGTGYDPVATHDRQRQAALERDLEFNAWLWEAEHGPRKD